MALTITWQELLIAVILATVIYLLETIILSRRRPARAMAVDPELKAEVHKLRAEVATLRHRLDEVETRTGVEDAPEMETLHSAYDYAVQFARQGMIAPEIAARCGISQDEASLIVALHRKSQEA